MTDVAEIASHETHEAPAAAEDEADRDLLVKGAVTVGVVAVGVALIEVALIPGMVIGVAAALAPKYLPKLGESLQPAFRSTVRGLYKLNRKTREAVAEASEHVQDIVAEVHAEAAPSAPAEPHAPV
jgi:hypothetical protein